MSEEKFDAIVVGGGLVGLTAAYCLTQAEMEVLVIETKYLDVFKTDQTDNPNYAEIFTEQVKITFTVDLTKAEIKAIGDNSILVRIPGIHSSYTVVGGTYDSIESYQKPGIAPGSIPDTITQETENHNKLIKSRYSEDKNNKVYKSLNRIQRQKIDLFNN